MRRLLFTLLLACGLLGVAEVRAGVEQAKALVEQTAETTLQQLRDQREELDAHPERIFELVEEIILPHFDFEAMSRWVLGKNWRKANEAQREAFTGEYRELLVRTYATTLLEYRDQTIDYLPLHAREEDRLVTVKTLINQSGGPAIPVNYRLYEKDGVWKVIDITVDNVSLVTNYRNSFNTKINKNGIDSLIEDLKQRNRESREGKS